MSSHLESKKIVVTGGAGFLGSFVVEKFRERGCRDIVIPRKKDYDLTQLEAVQQLFKDTKPHVLVHLAAVVGGIGANMLRPADFFYENLIMGAQLIHTAVQHGLKKLVLVGTVCSYPKYCPVPFREVDLWNGYPDELNAPSGIAKKALLVQAQSYASQYGLDSLYLIPVNLYGPRDNFDPQTSHVIPALIRKCVEAVETGAAEIVCWGTGTVSREFLYVEDAAEAIVKAVECLNHIAEPINLGTGREITIKALAETIVGLSGFRGQLRWDPSKPDGQPRRCVDVTRAEKYIGFRAPTPLVEGLRRTLTWYLAQPRKLTVQSTGLVAANKNPLDP